MKKQIVGWRVGFLALLALAAACGGESSNPCDPNPCTKAHQTVCTIGGSEAVCRCDAGYIESNGACVLPCDADTKCAAEHRQCINGATAATCGACLSGYHEENGKCVADENCAGNPCNHGTCDDTSGRIVCTCQEGWAGARCDSCAGGYHLENGNCVLDQQCLANTCSGHGTCDDSSGLVKCTCNTGYTGNFCEKCATGYHLDTDGTCVINEKCSDTNPCGDRGTCDDSSGEIKCICKEGYSGAHCENCAPGYATSCSGHGECKQAGDKFVCECESAYQGDFCQSCAEGYELSGNICVDEDDPGISGEECPTALEAGNLCRLFGNITTNQRWLKKNIYLLSGGVFVGSGQAGEGVNLIIEPGVHIYGDAVAASTSALIIQRGSKIYALGNKRDPIVMTSSLPAGSRNPGDWGGLIINGWAPINGCTTPPCERIGEGDTGLYGGSDPNDSSGVLKYVRIEFSGKQITPTKEFNGLALQGVGAGTKIHHIHAHKAADDTLEFFGGTANVKYFLATGGQDDYMDWTEGWSGKVQFFIGQQHPGAGANNGIEADNLEGDEDSLPRSTPTIYNVTLIGNGDGADCGDGLLLRRGTAGVLRNIAVMNFKKSCLNIYSLSTWNQVDAGALVLTNSMLNCTKNFADDSSNPPGKTETAFFNTAGWENRTGDLQLTDPLNITQPNFKPKAGSPALTGAAQPPAGDNFFESVNFIGGMGEVDWTAGWTAFPEN